MLDIKNEPALKDGEPCGHPSCLSHISHPCEGCGRIGGYKKATPPETIYLQCYDEYTGNLLDFVSSDVAWCRDRINDNDAVYILATPELAELLDRLADEIPVLGKPMVKWAKRYHCSGSGAVDEARTLATHIKASLG